MHTQDADTGKQNANTSPSEARSSLPLTLIFICRTRMGYEAWIQLDKWLQGILLIHPSLHIDLFMFIYLSAEKKTHFPLDCFDKSLHADVLSGKLSGSL